MVKRKKKLVEILASLYEIPHKQLLEAQRINILISGELTEIETV